MGPREELRRLLDEMDIEDVREVPVFARRLASEREARSGARLPPEMQGKLFRILREAQATGGDLDEARVWLWLRVEDDPELRPLRAAIDRYLDGAGEGTGTK
jgi:hypothetical protein